MMKRHDKALPEGTALKNGRYILGKVLGVGGFGITYDAKDSETGESAAIKEYMPSGLAERNGSCALPISGNEEAFKDGYSRFQIEWQVLDSLRNIKHIVRAQDFFRENSTAYIVMERLSGADVKELLSETPPQDALSFCEAIVRNIGAALIEVHNRGIIHLDVSPANIFFQPDGSLRLIDFGSAIYMNDDSLDTVQLKHGYAPPELYKASSPKGPWTDVYALAATFYTLLTGLRISPAEQRLKDDKLEPLLSIRPEVPKHISDSIHRALSLSVDGRYRTILEFLRDFNNTPLTFSVAPAPAFSSKQEQKRAAAPGFMQRIATGFSPKKEEERPAAPGFTQRNTDEPEKAAVLLNKIGQRLAAIPQKLQGMMPSGQETCTPSILVSSARFGTNTISLSPNNVYKIGRASGNGLSDFVVTDDRRVSKVHLTLRFDRQKAAFEVTDMSSNGSFYPDGRRLGKGASQLMYPGETVYLGSPDCTIKFVLS